MNDLRKAARIFSVSEKDLPKTIKKFKREVEEMKLTSSNFEMKN